MIRGMSLMRHTPPGGMGAHGSLGLAAPARALLVTIVFLLLFLMWLGSSPAAASPLSERRAELEAAQARLGQLQAELNEFAVAFGNAEARAAEIEEAIVALEADEARSLSDLAEAQAQLERRLVGVYKGRNNGFALIAETLLTHKDLAAGLAQIELLKRVAGQDRNMYGGIKRHLVKVDARQRDLQAKRVEQAARMEELKQAQADLEHSIAAVSAEYRSLKKQVAQLEEQERKEREAAALRAALAAGTIKSVGGFVFPVDGPHSFTDTWGDPRSGGRTHQGQDIFAARGTPCVACYNGTISRTYWNQGLGGTGIWLDADNGVSYYYCHLDGIAGGISAGVRVTAGQVIGYVGDSGNALGGPCHLHFQAHPGGGSPVNPYGILVSSDR